jgi:hypothetical protein
MATAEELADAKKRVSAAVLKLSGVAGVGLSARSVRVYLEDASPELRARVGEALDALKLGVPVDVEATGKFHRQ